MGGEASILPKNDSQVVKNAFSWGLQKLCDSMHRIYLQFCFGQIIKNLDRIRYLVKHRCNFFEYSISSPTKRIFYPNWTLPKRHSFFLCKITNITSRICTEQSFAPKFILMARNRRWIPPGARACRRKPRLPAAQQLCAPARHPHATRALPALCPHAACMSLVPTSLRITVDGLYCTPTENLSRFCKIFTIFRINCFPVWNN